MLMSYWIFLCCTFLLSFTACDSLPASHTALEQNTLEQKEIPSRRALAREAMQSPTWRWVFNGKTSEDRHRLKEMLDDIAHQIPLDMAIEVEDFNALSPAELAAKPLIFIGNTWPKEIAQHQPELLHPNSFRGVKVQQKNEVLRLNFILQPWSLPDTPRLMHLIYCPDVDALREHIYQQFSKDWGQLLFASWDYEIHRNNQALLKGQFQRNTWQADTLSELHFTHEQEPFYQDTDWIAYAPEGLPNNSHFEQARQELNQAKQQLYQKIGILAQGPISLHFYPSVERIGLRRQSMNPAQYEPRDASIHLVLQASPDKYHSPDIYHALLQAMQQQALGVDVDKADFLALAGAMLAIVSKEDYASSYRGFAQALARHHQLLPPEILLHRDQRNALSPYIYDASLLAFTEYLLDNQLTSVEELATGKWSENWLKIPENWPNIWLQKAPPETPKIPPAKGFQRGMTFAHEGYQGYNGYGGHLVAPSLDSLSSLAINSLAIVPYTYLPGANKLGGMPISNFAGGENDDAVIHSIRQAHQRNCSVLLKPQIWVQGAWPGDINFATETEWQQFFDRYTQWIAHYAILAQEEGVEALCLGTEMVRSTVDHPEKWRKIIALVRSLYSGQITYAANWGEEFDNFSLWHEFDVIGLNAYYPLSNKAEATDAELLAGATQWVQAAEKIAQQHQKNWWLTEVGFRSVAKAWLNPHADAAGRPASQEAQTRCYQALIQALEKEAPSLSGIYVWKWPSYLGRESRRAKQGTGFTPGGKTAATLLKTYYERKR